MGKSGKTGSSFYSSTNYSESKSGKSLQMVQSMPMEDDDAMSIVYIGKSSKDMRSSKSGKEESGMKAKSEKMDMSKSGKYDDDMSIATVDDDMSIVYVGKSSKESESKAGKSEETEAIADIMHQLQNGKADKESVDMSKSGKAEEQMSMIDDDEMSYVYMAKSSKTLDAKAGKASYPADAKSGKSVHAYYGKSGKASHSMSMVEVDDDMSDADGEWIPITTEAAITTVAATEPAATTVPPAATTVPPPVETTAAASTEAPGSASTTPALPTSTGAPGLRFDRDKIVEEEIMLLQEGKHGGEGHVHSKAGDTVEISSKIASGNHIRPDALQQQSDSASLSTSRYSMVAVCVVSLVALTL